MLTSISKTPVSDQAQIVLTLDEPGISDSKRHILELDGLRGAAALVVVFYHISQAIIYYAHGILHKLLDVFLLGYLGVDVFFTLSGFLITGILLEKKTSANYYRNFYMRRFLRLAPCYLITLVLVRLFIPGSGAFLALSLLYIANFASLCHVPFSYSVLWSLSVEEQFYMIWPTVIRGFSPPLVAIISGSICLMTPALRLYEAFHGGFNLFFSWYRFDGMAWGALLAVALKCGWVTLQNERKTWLAIASAGAILFASCLLYAWSKQYGIAIIYTAASLFTAIVIGLAVSRQSSLLSVLRTSTLRFFGDISYWMYLFHLMVINGIIHLLKTRFPSLIDHGGWVLFAIMLAGTMIPCVVTGIFVRKWIEIPLLRLKSRFN